MNEDIKILKTIVKIYHNYLQKGEEIDFAINERHLQAIENVLEERELDKKQLKESWNNNLELSKKIKELEKENRKLKVIRSEYAYGYENIYFITKNDLVQIDKNKYLIEIENGKFVDLKQVYLDNKNGIPKQKIKDKIDEINKKYEDSRDENGESPYYYPEYTIRVLKKLLQESEDI